MMSNKLIYAAVTIAAITFFASCKSDNVKVSGRIAGADSQTLTLERTTAAGTIVADTTVTDEKGYFKFNITLPGGHATIYNLNVGNSGDMIPLFLSPGEKVSVNSFRSNIRNYHVDGSHESELMKEINEILTGGAARLDSIAVARNLYDGNDEDRRAGITEYHKEYIAIKRRHIEFIVTNSNSLSAIYALYQRLPGDEVLFNGDNDIIYYRTVADSVGKYHPDSPYLTTLRSAINEYDKGEELVKMINEQLENPLPFPNISMQDVKGVTHNLSGLYGKVILLDYWVAGEAQAAIVNAEYKELYEKYEADGFEIFQVNIGTSKPVWVNAVLDQKLPWISVSDLRGESTPAVGLYNIKTLPANIIISSGGDIVARNLYGDKLEKEIEKQLRNSKR